MSRIWTEVGTHPLGLKTAHLPQGIRPGFRICNLYRFSKSPFAILPRFFSFSSTPLECPHSRPPPVQTAAEIEQTRPVRELCSDWAKPLMFPAYHPNMWRHSRFYHCRDRRVAPCWAVCAQEGANERLRAKPSSSARVLWAHLLRRASGEASHPVRSCWRSSGSACHARWASSRMRSRHRHAPFLCSLLVSSGHLEWAGRGSLVGLQL